MKTIYKFLLIATAGVGYIALDAIISVESMVAVPHIQHSPPIAKSRPQVTPPEQQELTALIVKVTKIQDRHPSLVKTQDRIVGGEE